MMYEPPQNRGNLLGNVNTFLSLYDKLKTPSPTSSPGTPPVQPGPWASGYSFPPQDPLFVSPVQPPPSSGASPGKVLGANSGGGSALNSAGSAALAVKGAEKLLGSGAAKAAGGAAGGAAAWSW